MALTVTAAVAQSLASALATAVGSAATVKIYSGSKPATPETAASGTLLVTVPISGTFTASGGSITSADPAAASPAASGTAGRDSVALAVGYAAIATLVVWLPIAAFVVAGDRAVGAIDAVARALAARQRAVTVVCLAVVGVLAVVHGLAQLA